MELAGQVKKIAALIKKSRHAVVLTGAGISTDSGVPDFRTPGSGLWTVVDPELFTIRGFTANPRLFYEEGLPFFRLIWDAKPNPAHRVLASLEREGYIKAIITQNVDGLHQKSGSKNVYQVHGSLFGVSCIHCQNNVEIESVLSDLDEGLMPPLCIECGEPLKPDVVLFGEPLAPDYRSALQEAKKADLILVVGTSLQVAPVNAIPGLGDKVVIINNTATHLDNQAEVVVNEPISSVLKLLHEEMNIDDSFGGSED